MPADGVSWLVELDVVDVDLVAREMHDHAADDGVSGQADFRQIAPQEIRAARDVLQRKLGAVIEFAVSVLMTNVAGIMKQRREDGHLRALGAETFFAFGASLVAGDKASERQSHIQRVLHIVIGRVAAEIARIAAREQSLEVVESQPDLVEGSARIRQCEQFMHGVTDGDRVADLNGIGDVVVVASVLGHDPFLIVIGS